MTAAGDVLGWDVGGANIKMARLAGAGALPVVVERPFPLWREWERLPSILEEMTGNAAGARTMAVTMTGELADCFATKREGVAFIVGAFRRAFPSAAISIYGVDGAFHAVDEAVTKPAIVAAANWMAAATLVARSHANALFIDAGSTTTDIVPILDGRVTAQGITDTSRLRSGALVYTGVLRTPVCAIVRFLPLGSGRCGVAAEHFAIAADVHRWLGNISEAEYTCETPDGRGRSREECGARLARMVCGDIETLDGKDIAAIANHVARAQVLEIVDGIRQVQRRLGADGPRIAVVCGAGALLAREAAVDAGLTPRDLADDLEADAARSTPAAAVAQLLYDTLGAGSR